MMKFLISTAVLNVCYFNSDRRSCCDVSICLWSHGVMNLVATHFNCTSPMDYISHHALHTHIPVHHYTNHTAVTIHSSTLIASPHLHLIHSLTQTLTQCEVLFFPWLTFLSVFPSLSSRVLPGLLTPSPDCLLPASLTLPAFW